MVQRLNINRGGYHGETIDITATLAEIEQTACQTGWQIERLPLNSREHLLALKRPAAGAGASLYLSTGMHGDEPAGPLSFLRLLHEDRWPAHLSLWACPCLNPRGFREHRRENVEGIDLNRDYRNPQTAEVRTHIAWLERQPGFDLALCLHEDWEAGGFYLYELNPDHRPSFAASMVNAVAAVCPIEESPHIEGRPAQGGVIHPDTDPFARQQWPEAIYLITQKTRQNYTLEAPSDYPLAARVAALTTAVTCVTSPRTCTPDFDRRKRCRCDPPPART